jgi:hypothetical protein
MGLNPLELDVEVLLDTACRAAGLAVEECVAVNSLP